MLKKTLGCLVVVGAVLAVIPSTCFALNRADVDAYCAARNATYSTSSQRCVCNSGYTESGDTCVSTSKDSSGGSSGGISTDPTTNIVQGLMNNNSQQFGIGLFGAIINDASRRNSEESARQAKEAQDRAEELRLANEKALIKQHDEMKNRLLGGMMNVGDSSQLGLMGAETGPGLALMTDDLHVKETSGAFGQKELKPIIGDAGPGAIKLDKDDKNAEKDSAKARKRFDTAGKLLNTGLPAEPSVPSTKPVSPAKLEKLNAMKTSLKKIEDEENALKAQLEDLNQSPSPDKNAIKEVQEKITVKQEEKKEQEKKYKNLEATDDDAASNQ